MILGILGRLFPEQEVRKRYLYLLLFLRFPDVVGTIPSLI